MSKSLRRLEGYFQIDHRESPGNEKAPEGKQYESATYTCSHCHYVVVVEPNRTRSRGYCPGCDRVICDGCEYKRAVLMEGCASLDRIFDELAEKEIKQDALQKLRIL